MFQDFNGDWRPGEYVFERAAFWVRIYNLPLGMRTMSVGESIGKRIGRLIIMDKGLEGGGWTSFLRLRVEINTKKPLSRVVKLQGAGQNCEVDADDSNKNPEMNQYGDWLRASSLKKSITFDKKQSSSAKADLFFSRMKNRREKNGNQDGESTVKEGNPVRNLNLEVRNPSDIVLKIKGRLGTKHAKRS
ncbi:hypothetical protein PTKIN_Ptkin09bG0188900 [Pterospermum kingtungense]